MKTLLKLWIALTLIVPSVFAHGGNLDEEGMVIGYDYSHDQYAELIAKYGEPKPIQKKKLMGVGIGDMDTFWAMNVANNQPTQVQATLRHIGKHCYIYLEVDQEDKVSQETIEKLAQQFDDKIYGTNHKFFGSESSPGIDFDERITLLLLDIQDGWEPGRGYVAGYFSPMDTVNTDVWQFSNEREMFYMDIYPGDPKRDDYLGILAHEFQHMIHYNYDKREKLWLNEAMSQIAFYVNGYGHAPQILAFIKNPDTQIDEFNNGLDDYGNVYLFMYYLLSKKLGDGNQIADVFSSIVQSELRSIESIDAVLKEKGYNFTIDEIIPDFLAANYINDPGLAEGQYGYDNTLMMKVQPTHVFSLDSLPTEEFETSVQQRGADFILLTDKLVSEPVNATLIDKIRIYSDYAATIAWNINDDNLPPTAFIPKKAEVDGNKIKMNTQVDDQGRHFIEVGPFRGAGVRVTQVNYEIQSEHALVVGEIPVFSFQTMATRPSSVEVVFDGQNKKWIGKDKRMTLRKFVEFKDGRKEISDIALDKKNDATFTLDLNGVKNVTLIPSSTLGGELDYTIKFNTGASSKTLSLLDEWQQDEAAFLNKVADYPELLNTLKKEWNLLGSDKKVEMGESFRNFLRTYQFKVLEQSMSGTLNTSAMADDQDDSHDNIAYLVSKARKSAHKLSHLEIDPKFLEGQILHMWKLLEIAKGFPHLPLPDGFAIKDYDMSEVNGILDEWAVHGGEDHKEPLRRLALAESVILSTYNEGLTMAEDTAMCVFDLVKFFFAARDAASVLLKPVIAKGGTIGKLAGVVLKKIQSKVIQILNKVVVIVSRKLPSPYNTILPIATSVITGIYRKVKDVPLSQEKDGWMKVFAVKTFGKFAMMSVPRVGIVDMGAGNVDYMAAKTLAMNTTHSVEDAGDAIRTELAPILEEIQLTHVNTEKKREYAQIAKWITQLTALTGTLNPTNISKVVGVISTIAGAGLLSHSIYKSSKVLYSIPGKVPSAIDAAFTPFANSKNIAPEFERELVDLENIVILNQKVQRAHDRYATSLEDLLSEGNLESLQHYMDAETEYSQALEADEMVLVAMNEDFSQKELIRLSQNSLLRSELEVEMLLDRQERVRELAKKIIERERKTLERVEARSKSARGSKLIRVSEVSRSVLDGKTTIQLKLDRLGRNIEGELQVFTSADCEIASDRIKFDGSTRTLYVEIEKKSDEVETLHLHLDVQDSQVSTYGAILNF